MKAPLDPEARSVLTDGLRPDPGYVLDAAVGTTYSLDLEALLLAPLAFSLFDSDTNAADPTALLAALRSHADRIAVYCDRTRITGADQKSGIDQRLLLLLESALHPVSAPGGGAFHPKVWVLRFRTQEGEVRHRILVLTRNQTFDRSWDLVVRLDESDESEGGDPVGKGAATLLKQLNELSPSPITASVAKSIKATRFTPPDGFDSAALHSFGLGSSASTDVPGAERVLVISPFLSAWRIKQLVGQASKSVVVSRPEALDKLGAKALSPFCEVKCFAGGDDSDDDGPTLTQLHAKAIISEVGGQTVWFVGSGNATNAAIAGNVEVMLELAGPKSKVGIDAILMGPKKGGVGFSSLLTDYKASDKPTGESDHEAELARLDEIVSEIARGEVVITARPEGTGGNYELQLELGYSLEGLEAGDKLTVRPVTVKSDRAAELTRGPRPRTSIGSVSLSKVTELLAFSLRSSRNVSDSSGKATTPSRHFVICGQLLNPPEGRDEHLLLELIPDKATFRLLLFMLLASGDPAAHAAELARSLVKAPSHADGAQQASALGIPLFESLLRTYSREPERLEAIGKTVERFQATEEGRERLPDGFAEMWAPFDLAASRAAR